jgi:hypothetical protein
MIEASNYINDFFKLGNVKEPKSVFDLRTKSKNRVVAERNCKLDYYNAYEYFDDEGIEKEDGRILARKYLNLRQDYFEKATEAHKRGWGAVAQYYAEMVRNCDEFKSSAYFSSDYYFVRVTVVAII